MYKTALAALSLALSFGLLTSQVYAADDQQGQGQGSNNQGNGNGDNPGGNGNSGSGNSGNGNSGNGNSGNGTGGNNGNSGTSNSSSSTSSTSNGDKSAESNSKSTSTTSSTSSTPAKAAPTAAAPVYVQTYGKFANTAKPVSTTTMTSTGAQKSTSTTTKTASIGKGGAASSTTTTAVTTTTTSSKRKDEVVVLQESPPKKYISTKKNQWQLFEGYINLKPGQEALPLTMTVTNQGYTGINMSIAGSKLASDKDFKGANLRMQMTGALAAGDNKLSVQTYGPVGANLSWKLTTLKPVITAIKPDSGSTEADITLTGRNFSKVAGGNQVLVDGKPAVIKAGSPASSKEIIFNFPKDLKSGKTSIVVSIGGIQSKPIEFNVNSAPEVTGVDLLSGPPGQAVTISGKGFSARENIVTIGGVPAPVSSNSATSITVTIPEMFFPQWNQAVVVKTGGIESKSNVKLNIQQRVIPNDGVPEQ